MKRLAIVLTALLLLAAARVEAAPIVVELTPKEWAKLETFEAHNLSDADKRFATRKWREAVAAYDSFVIEFPESKAIPYSLVKKGLSLENDDKRYKAIEAYQEVLDYFPNVIAFAAPALYYIGRCHQRSDDMDKALRHYAEMANDEDYATHPLAAHALHELANNLMKQKRVPEAIKYFRRIAVEFKKTNHDARVAAIPRVIAHYVRTQPDEAGLRKFYTEAGSFHSGPRAVKEDLSNDWDYWSHTKSYVRSYGSFGAEKVKERKQHYAYWAPKVGGKFGENDDYVKDVIELLYLANEDRAAWHKRMDALFDANQKVGDYDRISRWIVWNGAYPGKVDYYYQKYNFEKMSNPEIMKVISVFYTKIGNQKLARGLIDKLDFDTMTDAQISSLVRGNLWDRDPPMVERICARMRDVDFKRWEVLEYFRWRYAQLTDDQLKRCIPLGTEVAGIDRYAQDAWHHMAHIHIWRSQYQEAIRAYNMADKPPQTLWEIVDAYLAWAKPEQAISTLQEIENFFEGLRPRAALRIAHVYKGMGKKKLHISGLRRVLKQYPKSGESSTAHVELEGMGILVKIGGALDAE
jgi:tetratricopeptide (TPR) repeat protein